MSRSRLALSQKIAEVPLFCGILGVMGPHHPWFYECVVDLLLFPVRVGHGRLGHPGFTKIDRNCCCFWRFVSVSGEQAAAAHQRRHCCTSQNTMN
jgi:hypothetical protein